jgi:hypothetical protein
MSIRRVRSTARGFRSGRRENSPRSRPGKISGTGWKLLPVFPFALKAIGWPAAKRHVTAR